MPTTPLKLPEELMQKAASAARELGLSPHEFIVEAIKQATHSAEMRSQLLATALAARAETMESGLGHSPDSVRSYLRARLADPLAKRPEGEPWQDSSTPSKP